MGVDLGPHLVFQRVAADGSAVLRPSDEARDGQRHQSRERGGECKTSIRRFPAAQEKPARCEQGAKSAGIACRGAVEVGGEHKASEQYYPSTRGSLEDTQEREEGPDRQGHAPRHVLVVDRRRGGDVHQHAPTHHGGCEYPVAGRLPPTERHRPAQQMTCSPEEERREQAGDNPGQKDRGSRQPPVETACDQENRHAQESREEPEVGVRVSLVDEGLDADRPIRDVQVPVEQRPRLDVVEVVRRHAPEGVESSRPEVPKGPEVRHGDDGDPDENGPGEAPAVSSEVWELLDILDCLARPEVGEGGAHVPESGSIGWRPLRKVSGGDPPRQGSLTAWLATAVHRSVARFPFCSRSPSKTNIGQRSPTRLWQSAIEWGCVAIGIFATVMTGVVPRGG